MVKLLILAVVGIYVTLTLVYVRSIITNTTARLRRRRRRLARRQEIKRS